MKSIDINWNWLDTHCSAPPSPFSKIGKLTNSAWTFSMFYLMTLGVLGLAKTCTRPPNNLDCDTSTRFPNQCQGLPAIKFSSPPTSHIDKCDQKFTKAAISRHCLCFIISWKETRSSDTWGPSVVLHLKENHNVWFSWIKQFFLVCKIGWVSLILKKTKYNCAKLRLGIVEVVVLLKCLDTR